MDVSKKNRVGNDLVDPGFNASISNASFVGGLIAGNSFKRQRDVNSHSKVDLGSSLKSQDTNKSPEQIKKRICSYNNDITSSLSSSAKRKPDESKRSYQLSQTMPIYMDSYEIQKFKMQKRHDINYSRDIRLDNLPIQSDAEKSAVSIPVYPTTNQVDYGVAPQRCKSEGSSVTSVLQTQKPRLTLFNKNYDVNNEAPKHDIGNEDDLDESSECAGIQFVKPKKLTSTGLKNSVIERTQKSKLALMLSGLRGELYHSNQDELDSPKKSETTEKKDENQIIVGDDKPLKTTSSVLTNGNTSTITQLNNPSENTNSAPQLNAKPLTKNTSPLVGLKLTAQNVPTASNLLQNVQNVKQIETPILTGFPNSNKSLNVENSTKPTNTTISFGVPSSAAQKLPTFNFGSNDTSNVTSTLIVTSTSASSSTTTTKSQFGLSTSAAIVTSSSTTTPTQFGLNVANITAATDNNKNINNQGAFTFGSNSQLKPAVTKESTINFGSNVRSELKPNALSSSFQFQTKTNSELISVSTTPQTTTTFSFGVPTNSQMNANSATLKSSLNLPVVEKTETVPATNSFSFGSSSISVKTTAPSSSSSGLSPFSSVFTSTVPNNTPTNFVASTAVPASDKNCSNNSLEVSKTLPLVFGGASSTNTFSSNSFVSKQTDKEATVTDLPTKSAEFVFGAESKSNNNSAFTFGGPVKSMPVSSNTSSATVTSCVSQNKTPFRFSSGNGIVSENKNPSNIFGGVTSGSSSTGGFSFGSSAATGDAQKSTPSFSFGTNSVSTQQATTGGFSFSASTAAKSNNISSSKTFSFGAPQTNNAQTTQSPISSQANTNLFTLPVTTANGSAPFNFGTSSTSVQSNATSSATNNIFAVASNAPTVPPTGDHRPIRRATRRLQK